MRAVHLMQVIATSGLAIALAGAPCFGATVLYVDDDAAPGGDGHSWQTAFMYLQDALYAARAPGVARTDVPGAEPPGAEVPGAGVEEIRVAQGRYQPDLDEAGNVTPGDREATFALISGTSLLGGYAGLGAPDPDARDIDLYETILTGDLAGNDLPDFVFYDENSFHVVTGSGITETAVIEGLTITAGFAEWGMGTWAVGGGVYIDESHCDMLACTIEKNLAVLDGAGVMTHDESRTNIIDCTFAGNAVDYDGGGLSIGHNCTATVSSCVFMGNTAGDYGAGACTQYSASSSFEDCVFTDNNGDYGGGLSCGGSASVLECSFTDNTASFGGGLHCSGDQEIYNCDLTGNTANSNGGALYCSSGTPIFMDCLFESNSAENGGAVSDYSEEGAVFINCTLRNNSAIFSGGAFWSHAKASPFLDHCLFEENTADEGGAFFIGTSDWKFGIATLSDCTFTSNTAELGGAMANKALAEPLLSNCVFTGNSAVFEGGAVHNEQAEPKFVSCSFTANTTDLSHGAGGAMTNFDSSHPTLYGCSFSENAAAEGGAMANFINCDPILENCTFTANTAMFGGAMHTFVGGAPTITDCTFEANQASEYGGAIWTRLATTTLLRTTLHANLADRGAGMYSDEIPDPLKVTECVFTDNIARIYGGAMFNRDLESLQVTDCAFERNEGTSQNCGGLCNWGALTLAVSGCSFVENKVAISSGWTSSGTVTNCTFQDNFSTGGFIATGVAGGELLVANCAFSNNVVAVSPSNAAPMTIEDCVFEDKNGVYHTGESLATIRRCEFRNTINRGVYMSDGAHALIEDCTFGGSGAAIVGDYAEELIIVRCSMAMGSTGIRCDRVWGWVTLVNCVITGSGTAIDADWSGIFLVNSLLTGNEVAFRLTDDAYCYAVNCTLADNDVGATVDDPDVHVGFRNSIVWNSPLIADEGEWSVKYSDIQGGWEGEGNIDADPLFVDPANGDYRLSAGSPCIDAADNDVVPEDEFDIDQDGNMYEPLPIDLDGSPRFVDDPDTEDTGNGEPPIVDMGAYEYQPPECPADFDGDGYVDTADLLHLLSAWGTPDGDIDGDGDTDIADLLALLAAWGECP